jgi:hypothetical protein
LLTELNHNKAINWAVSEEVDIICLSWTVDETLDDDSSRKLKDALDKAQMPVFCAINDRQPEAEVMLRSSAGVFAIRHADVINPAEIRQEQLKHVDFLVPGKGVEVHLPSYLSREGTYVTDQGSSYAAAAAAGLASLVLGCAVFTFGRDSPEFDKIRHYSSMERILKRMSSEPPSNAAGKRVQPWNHFPKRLNSHHHDFAVSFFRERLRTWARLNG